MKYNTLIDTSLSSLHQTFITAFADYSIKIQPSLEVYQQRMQRITYDANFSVGTFQGEEMVGFITNGVGKFYDKNTAYNGGTGVIKDFRGNKLTKKMYDFILPILKKEGIGQCLLEVIDDNIPALKSYRKIGFQEVRKLRCFNLPNGIIPTKKSNLSIQLVETDEPNWETYLNFQECLPSWQNSFFAIQNSLPYETIIEVYYKANLIGFVSFDPVSGRISQIAVQADFRRQGVGNSLLRAVLAKSIHKNLSILNIDNREDGIIKFFLNSGFQPTIEQYEMVWEV